MSNAERKPSDGKVCALLEQQDLIFRKAKVGILLLQNRRILECNEHIAEMFGLATPNELIGQSTRIFYPSDEAFEAAGKQGYLQLASKGHASFEAELCRQDGTPIWVVQKGRPLDPDHVIEAPSIWVYTDITSLKAADLARRRSEQRFSTAFDSCPLAASISEISTGRFIEVNASYEINFGWSKTDLVGKTSLEIGFWADESTRGAWLESMARVGRLIDYETIWRHKSGDRRHVSLSSEIVELDGTPCILTYVSDITSRKWAEADLRIAAAAFESQQGMVVTDADSVILRVNRAFTELTGYAAEEVVGKKPNLMKSDRHDDDFYQKMWESLGKTGQWQGEIWDRRKNGEIYPKWLTISAVKDEAGDVPPFSVAEGFRVRG